MRCRYCFYTDEAANRQVSSFGRMSAETMHTIIDKAMEYGEYQCTFAFQGGEPTLAGLDFFRDLVSYASSVQNPRHLRLNFAIQTNGLTLNEEWARFFADNHFLVGISLDGTKDIHDRYRTDASGKGTYSRVMSAIQLLKKYNVDFNILTVVTSASARSGQRLYNFFRKNDLTYQQYIECLDPISETPGQHDYSLTPERYAEFLKSIFDAWYLDVKNGNFVYNRYFDNLMMIIAGQMPESCNMSGVCSDQWVFEADGSVYPCDFYALDEWRLGNINEDSFEQMQNVRQSSGFVSWSERIHPDCKECRYFKLCRGGCRRNREPVTETSTGKNYFCESYKEFFDYSYPRLMEIYHTVYEKGI